MMLEKFAEYLWNVWSKKMEEFIVIAKPVEGQEGKFENHQILKLEKQPNGQPIEPQLPEGFQKVSGPASREECENFIASQTEKQEANNEAENDGKAAKNGEKERDEAKQNFLALTYLQYALISVVTLGFVIVIIFGAAQLFGFWSKEGTILANVKNPDEAARTLITFLVAVSTVAIAFLAILTAMVIRQLERFALAKEVLSILVGILGTIVGFYFGTASNNGNAANTNTQPGTTASPVNGNGTNATPAANQPANNNTNGNTDVNRTTGRTVIFRAPLEKGRYVSFVDRR